MSTKDYLEKDFYKTLGVAKTAKPAEIKTAYRKLARKYHPDSNQGDAKAEERFKEISEAYSVLSDEKRRKEYDEARSLFGGGFRVPSGTRTNTGGFGGFDLNDIFSGAGDAAGGLGTQIAAMAAPWQRELDLLKSLPGFGDVVTQVWLAEIGPAPHLHFSSHEKLACWVSLCPGNNISARKRKHGRTGDAGTYIKPMLVQAAWSAIRVRGRLQARYNRLVRRFGGQNNPGAKKKAILAIAHTLLKIAYQVLKSGMPYQDLGADFYTRRESPAQRQAFLERQLQKLHPGCTITVTISPPEAALLPGA